MQSVDYGEKIQEAASRSGKPVMQIVREAGISHNTWYDIVREKRMPRLDTLLLIMDAMGCKSLDEMLGIVP